MDKFYMRNADNMKFALEIFIRRFGKHKINFSAQSIPYLSNLVVWCTFFLIQGLLTILA